MCTRVNVGEEPLLSRVGRRGQVSEKKKGCVSALHGTLVFITVF